MEMVEHVTRVPNAPPFVDGVVFSRGQVVPVVNLRARFGFERAPYDLRTRLVVVQAAGRSRRPGRRFGARVRQHPAASRSSRRTRRWPGMSGRYVEGVASLGDAADPDARPVRILNFAESLPLDVNS